MFHWVALVTLKWSGQITWTKVFTAMTASFLGVALALPLLVPQFLQTRNAARTMPQNLGQITGEKWGFLVPDPWLWTNIHGQGELKTKGLILYSGTTLDRKSTRLNSSHIP